MGRVQNSSGSGWGLAWDFGSGFFGFQLLNKFRVWSGSGSKLKSTFGFSGFRHTYFLPSIIFGSNIRDFALDDDVIFSYTFIKCLTPLWLYFIFTIQASESIVNVIRFHLSERFWSLTSIGQTFKQSKLWQHHSHEKCKTFNPQIFASDIFPSFFI